MAERAILLELDQRSDISSQVSSFQDHPENDKYFSETQSKVFELIFQRLDINGDGEVSPSELRRALKFMNIRVDKSVCKRMVTDFNEDGYLNFDIFMSIVTDVFREGYLDPAQYKIELAEDQKKIQIKSTDDLLKIFHSFDKDNSGNISKLEIQSLAEDLGHAMTEQELEEFMKRADRDGDGNIDQEEFIEYFKNVLF